MKIGILALQGAVNPHKPKLEALRVTPVEVKYAEDLEDISGIILPGGESTTMLHLLSLNDLWEPLQNFVRTRPTWGVCAGAILLAKRVTHPEQSSLAAISLEVQRNAYGRQGESFIAPLNPTANWPDKHAVEGVFIRAPKITQLGDKVRTLLDYRGEPVLVEENNVMVSTFHPELTASLSIHQYFLEKALALNG